MQSWIAMYWLLPPFLVASFAVAWYGVTMDIRVKSMIPTLPALINFIDMHSHFNVSSLAFDIFSKWRSISCTKSSHLGITLTRITYQLSSESRSSLWQSHINRRGRPCISDVSAWCICIWPSPTNRSPWNKKIISRSYILPLTITHCMYIHAVANSADFFSQPHPNLILQHRDVRAPFSVSMYKTPSDSSDQ
jgi:hypothetical protein